MASEERPLKKGFSCGARLMIRITKRSFSCVSMKRARCFFGAVLNCACPFCLHVLAVDFLFFRIESRRLYVFFYAMPTVTFTLQLSIMFLFGISFQFVFGAAYWLCTRTIVTVCRLGTCGTICHVVSM